MKLFWSCKNQMDFLKLDVVEVTYESWWAEMTGLEIAWRLDLHWFVDGIDMQNNASDATLSIYYVCDRWSHECVTEV